jgi:hypothetical protein
MFKEPIERIIFEKLREDNVEDINRGLTPNAEILPFIGMVDQNLDFETTQKDNDSAIILI